MMPRLFVILVLVMAFVVQPASAKYSKEGFADLVEALQPSVVNISTQHKAEEAKGNVPQLQFNVPPGSPLEEFFNNFMDNFQNGVPFPNQDHDFTSLGAGFILDSSGHIVTNNHVIAEADEITVTLSDGSQHEAKLIGRDAKTDLALLKISTKQKLQPVRWGNSDQMRVGDVVLAIGNPFGLQGTVSAGIISARARDINAGPYDDFIQTDASINRGNSGGPMFNTDGEVIGINTAIFSPTGGSVGIGFAIPSTLAQPVIAQLQKYGHTRRGWLGVRIQEITPEIAEGLGLSEAAGALIAEVTPQGPAADAGLKARDVILQFNGKDINAMRKLPRVVAETPIGEPVPVVVWRDGKKINVKVKVGELEAAEQAGLTQSEPSTPPQKAEAPAGVDVLGMRLSNMSPALKQRYNITATKGVVVTNVVRGSTAAENMIRAGDVVREVGQQVVATTADVERQVKLARDGKKSAVLLLIQRGNEDRFVALKLQAD